MKKYSLLPLLLIGIPFSLCFADNSLSLEILHEFELPGALPLAAVTEHSNGVFYGTTALGGTHNQGSLFSASPSGGITLIHSFDGNDGKAPSNSLVEGGDGALYGTAPEGGAFGFGTLFKITPEGIFTKLVDFTGSSGEAPGSVPGSLVLHPDGNLYGIAKSGGSLENGTVFKYSLDGTLTTLIEFSGADGDLPGMEPVGPLAFDGSTLYGATRFGGVNSNGVIFSVTTGGTYQLLGAFTGNAGSQIGANPSSGLIKHSDGNLYGSTEFGGSSSFGVFYKIESSGANFAVLHHFSDQVGSKPSGSLVEDSSGALWGTTSTGGTLGLGTLYSITTSGQHTKRVDFSGVSGAATGSSPTGGVRKGADNRFYGTTSAGGPGQRGTLFAYSLTGGYELLDDFTTDIGWSPSGAVSLNSQGERVLPLAEGGVSGNGLIVQITDTDSISPIASMPSSIGGNPNGILSSSGSDSIGISTSLGQTGRGSAFKLTASGELNLLSGFTSTAGEGFLGPLLLTVSSDAYGVSQAGGLGNNGALFKIDPVGNLTREFSFTGTGGTRKGNTPRAPLAQTNDGMIYGVTQFGGMHDNGTLFRYSDSGVMETLFEFAATGPGQPAGGLILAPNGKLYGTTREGGDSGAGTVFEFNSVTNELAVVASFTGESGALPGSQPAGPLTLGIDGRIYGLTLQGGNGFGTAFQYTPDLNAECLAIFTGTGGPNPGITHRELKPGLDIVGGIGLGNDGRIYGSLPAGGSKGGGVVFRLNTVSPLDAWKLDNLGSADAPDFGDADNDQIPNIFEYAFDLSPNQPDNRNLLSPSLEFANGEAHLAITLSRNTLRFDVKIIVEAASSLSGPWSIIAQSEFGQAFTGSATITETPVSESIRLSHVRDAAASVPGSPRFIRLRVSR
jgi:uncharacterized repeat protein (TIGR03803 family)